MDGDYDQPQPVQPVFHQPLQPMHASHGGPPPVHPSQHARSPPTAVAAGASYHSNHGHGSASGSLGNAGAGAYDFLLAGRGGHAAAAGHSAHSAGRSPHDGSSYGGGGGGSYGGAGGGGYGLPSGAASTVGGESQSTWSEHLAHLDGRLEYIELPTLQAVDHPTPDSAQILFLGHMRFETTGAELRWLIRRFAGVSVLKAESRGSGCFNVYLANEADAQKVRGLHKRMLFDHRGVWFARTPEETGFLADYVDHVLARMGKKRLRLPKDCMVVEEPRSRPQSRVNAGTPHAGGHHTPNASPHHPGGSPYGAPAYGGGGGGGAPYMPPGGYGGPGGMGGGGGGEMPDPASGMALPPGGPVYFNQPDAAAIPGVTGTLPPPQYPPPPPYGGGSGGGGY